MTEVELAQLIEEVRRRAFDRDLKKRLVAALTELLVSKASDALMHERLFKIGQAMVMRP